MAENAWRPIESAPKDGSYIIAGRFGGARELRWVQHSRWLAAADACDADFGDDPDEYEAGWSDQDDDLIYPTHWMPLQPPENL